MINKDRVRTMTRLAIYEEGLTLRMIILSAIW